MTQKEKETIIKFLRENGFRPREDKDLKKYITQLNVRLGKQGKKIYIKENGETIQVSIEDKKPIVPKNHTIYSRSTDEEFENYSALAKTRNITLSRLVYELLEKEYQNARANNDI